MYQNHHLRSELQEWKNRLYKTSFHQADNSFNHFFDRIKEQKKLNSLLILLKEKYPIKDEEITNYLENSHLLFRNTFDEKIYISIVYHILAHIRGKKHISIFYYTLGTGGDQKERLESIFENFVEPLTNYLHDNLDKDNTTLYLLEKYKKRTEWFTKDKLVSKYQNAKKEFEQIFEDDLRMYLFDQGIEYPFSTPKSSSGRADVVANIETEEPLVLEIKIFDSNKKYGKDRIKKGFNQIVKYANDYNKNIGYLIIFNLDQVELEFKFNEQNKMFPSCIEFNNKFYYFITINLNFETSASKSNLKKITITENELIE